MSCLTGELLVDCVNTARAGISRIFVACACSIDSFTASNTDWSFTAVTMDTTADLFYEYQGEVEQKSFNAEGALNETGGTPSFTNTVEIKFIGMNKTNLKRLQDLVDSRKVTVIMETPNSSGAYNRAFVVGWDNLLKVDAAARPNAKAVIEGATDGENSATIILTAKHAEFIREFVGTIQTPNGAVQFGT